MGICQSNQEVKADAKQSTMGGGGGNMMAAAPAQAKKANDGEHYTIDYFEVHGRTESIICMLNHAGASYVKNGIPMAEWPAKKATFPNGVIPLITLKNGK